MVVNVGWQDPIAHAIWDPHFGQLSIILKI